MKIKAKIEERIEEFLSFPLEKFKEGNTKIKFEDDKVRASSWFHNNKNQILEYSSEVRKQFEEYKQSLKIEREIEFKKKLIEFANVDDENMKKFNSSNRTLKFSTKELMGLWFLRNKEKILNGTEEVNLKIIEQYETWLNSKNNIFYKDDNKEVDKNVSKNN